jgi:hypothetical protein
MKILICGDLIIYDKISGSTENIFGEFSTIIKDSEVAIYNQEFPITTHPNVYPTKKYGLTPATSLELLRTIKDSGFTHATLANNHIFNRGMKGLEDTISNLEGIGVKTMGAGMNLRSASKTNYFDANGFNIAFINCAENEFNSATNNHGGSNPLDLIRIVEQIQKAKENAKFIFLIIHGGIDYCRIPSPRMIRMYRFLAKQGASAIIGHHSHVVSGYEVYQGVPIFYGIGNFVPGKIITKDCLYSFPIQFEIHDNSKMSFQGYPLHFDQERGCLRLLKGDELTDFNKEQTAISNLLNNIETLKETILGKYLTQERESYYFTLFTRSNYFLFKVFRKLGLIKIYHKYMLKKMQLNKKNTALWNLFRCETHNDVLDLIYEKHIDTYKND